eukprot:TRINITY_DN5752_c0_g1_i6.p1 TRINITY_DN5752_c0_g1~~TRINITY_DN5752_c0_g1_i6.p1  ORF type:complete len:107 (-),score=2.80 TRINITY_DN5752_c0_g1_i6:103-423(-)
MMESYVDVSSLSILQSSTVYWTCSGCDRTWLNLVQVCPMCDTPTGSVRDGVITSNANAVDPQQGQSWVCRGCQRTWHNESEQCMMCDWMRPSKFQRITSLSSPTSE